MPRAREVSSVPAASEDSPYRSWAYSGTSGAKPSAALPYRKLIRFITPKPRPVRNRSEMNGDSALAECRTKATAPASGDALRGDEREAERGDSRRCPERDAEHGRQQRDSDQHDAADVQMPVRPPGDVRDEDRAEREQDDADRAR